MNPANLTCERCIAIHKGPGGLGKPPCPSCPKPFLWAENVWLWELFCALNRHPVVAGLGGFIGWDYNVLHFLLKAKAIPERLWPRVLDTLDELLPIAQKHFNPETKT